MAVEQQLRKIGMVEAEARFKDLKLVQGINFQNISDVTPIWLEGYVKACEREIAHLYKSYDQTDAKRYEVQVRERIKHVKHLCSTIFALREG